MKPRPEVRWFAERMEKRLRANDHKGGWQDECLSWLFARALGEMGEAYRSALAGRNRGEEVIGTYLVDELYRRFNSTFVWPPQYDTEAVIGELTDAANFLMMVVDNLQREAQEGE